MKKLLAALAYSFLMAAPALADDLPQTRPLSEEDAAAAAENYQNYCSLCHGEDRQGYANDHAPSLRSKELLFPGNNLFLFRSIKYGRPGTAMAAYREDSGGPMGDSQIFQLVNWLYEQIDVDPVFNEDGERGRLPYTRIEGDIDLGAQVYARECASCHGANGEGDTAPMVFNQVMLIFASDLFLKKTIEEGRSDTPMAAFKDKLSEDEINGVTAYLRSKARGEGVIQPADSQPPAPEEYVLNPDGEDPEFDLQDGLYVAAADLNQALQEKRRMVILDTRATSWWRMGHIEGAVPIPYYSDFDEIVEDLPRDIWIVGYCECPRALATDAINNLRDRGFEKTAVLWEGIQGWAGLGYPILLGEVETVETDEE